VNTALYTYLVFAVDDEVSMPEEEASFNSCEGSMGYLEIGTSTFPIF
jgi:hypothetical protein